MKRYDLINIGNKFEPCMEMVESKDGEWVRFLDIKETNKTKQNLTEPCPGCTHDSGDKVKTCKKCGFKWPTIR